MSRKNYIITSGQYNAKPNKEVLSGLEKLAEKTDAEIIVMPTKGRTVQDDFLHPSLQEFTNVSGEENINKNLKLHNLQINSNQIRPQTGVRHFVKDDRGLIFGHPKQTLSYIANEVDKLPKPLASTGAVTLPNYGDVGRINEIARKDHKYGGVFVSVVDDRHFHFRHVQALKNGKFQDVTGQYNKNNWRSQPNTESIVFGDIHAYALDEKHKQASKEQVEELKPKHGFIHDLFDGYSINPWIQNKSVSKYKAFKEQGLSLEDELELTADVLEEYASMEGLRGKLYVVGSNHDEWIDRYLQEGGFLDDKGNEAIGARLYSKMIEGYSPLEAGLREAKELPGNVEFIGRGDSVKIRGVEHARHFDERTKGGKTNPRSLEDKVGKATGGHTHTPYMERDIVVAGTSTVLPRDFQSGYDNSLQSNVVLYSDGGRQILNTVGAEWK